MLTRLIPAFSVLFLALNACGTPKSGKSGAAQPVISQYSGFLNIGCSYPTTLKFSGSSGTFEMFTALCMPLGFKGTLAVNKNTKTLISDQNQLIGNYRITNTSDDLILQDTDRKTGDQKFSRRLQ